MRVLAMPSSFKRKAFQSECDNRVLCKHEKIRGGQPRTSFQRVYYNRDSPDLFSVIDRIWASWNVGQ